MRSISSAKLLIVFAVALSLATIPGPLALNGVLPRFNLAHAATAPSVSWIPAGPSTNNLVFQIYANEQLEFNDMQAQKLDLTDWPLTTQSLVNQFSGQNQFFVTNYVNDTGYFELQFMQDNVFWGCNFNFGTAPCGVDIRQGIAHGLDKNIFITQELGGLAIPIDNPVPIGVSLNTPDPCNYDRLFPQGTAGSSAGGCQVDGPGNTAYHLAAAVPCGLGAGSVCNPTGSTCPVGGTTRAGALCPAFSYTPGFGTPDFCAAADHFVAAGLATGKTGTPGTGTCELTGVTAQVTATQPGAHIFVRSDNTPRLHAGDSYAQFLCALFGFGFVTGCAYLAADNGPITAFPGFTTSPTSVTKSWWIYTAGFGNVLSFDSSLYFGYNSRFVSGISSIQPPCSNLSVPSFAAGNYMYICSPLYDANITSAEFAPCLRQTPGDPAAGQLQHGPASAFTITFANCSSTTSPSAASAAYKAEWEYGSLALSVPWWDQKDFFAYQSIVGRAVSNGGGGLEPPQNFFATLNAIQYTEGTTNLNCPTESTVSGGTYLSCEQGFLRQGFKQPFDDVNPFIGNTVWDAGVIGAVWDSPGATNPATVPGTDPNSYFDYMTTSTRTFAACPLPTTTSCPNNGVGYNTPAGTTTAFRYTLRNDIYWQGTTQLVRSWDIAFGDLAFLSTGVGSGLTSLTGIKIVSPTQIDLLVGQVPVNAKLDYNSIVIPGRTWVNQSVCTTSQWDSFVANTNFATANSGLLSCIAPSTAFFTTGTGNTGPGQAILLANQAGGTASNIDSSKTTPSYDPIASGTLSGSGAWVCKSSTGVVGTGCDPTNNQTPNPGDSITFSRYGLGTSPGQGPVGTYFRSAGTLALWTWTGDRGDPNVDFLNYNSASHCYLAALGTSGCTQWQQGIGAPGGSSTVGVTQINAVLRFIGVNWISPFDWANSPPTGLSTPFPPTLYEGTNYLQPARIALCTGTYPNAGYDC